MQPLSFAADVVDGDAALPPVAADWPCPKRLCWGSKSCPVSCRCATAAPGSSSSAAAVVGEPVDGDVAAAAAVVVVGAGAGLRPTSEPVAKCP